MAQKPNGNKKLKSSPVKSAKSSKEAVTKKAKPAVKPGKAPAKSEKAPAKSEKAPAKSDKSAKPVAKEGPKLREAVKGKESPKLKDVKGKPTAKDAAKSKEGAKPKEPPKRKRKSSAVVRLKAYWGVFNQMLKRVAVFEYAERKQADKKAGDLSVSSKQPHFVQLVKEIIREEE